MAFAECLRGVLTGVIVALEDGVDFLVNLPLFLVLLSTGTAAGVEYTSLSSFSLLTLSSFGSNDSGMTGTPASWSNSTK